MSVYMEKNSSVFFFYLPANRHKHANSFLSDKTHTKKSTTNHTYYTTQIKYTLASALMIILRGMK